MSWAALALLGVLLAAGPASAQASWRPVVGPDESFTVDMPGRPAHSDEVLKTDKGTPYDLSIDVFDSEEAGVFVIQTACFPTEEGTTLRPRARLQVGLDDAASRIKGGKWDKVTWRTHQGADAVEAVGVHKEGATMRILSVLKGCRLFSLTFAGEAKNAYNANAQRFFNSLRINVGAQ